MSAGSLRERVAEALDVHTVLTGVRDLRKRCTCGWSSAERQGLPAHREHLADAVLAEVREWMASEEAREVVARAVLDERRLHWQSVHQGECIRDSRAALAALIDKTKEAPRSRGPRTAGADLCRAQLNLSEED